MPTYCVFCRSNSASPCKPIGSWNLRRFEVPFGLIEVFSHEHCLKIEAIKQMRRRRLDPLLSLKQVPATFIKPTIEVQIPIALASTASSDTSPSSTIRDRSVISNPDAHQKPGHQRVRCLILGARQVQENGCVSGQISPYLPHAPSLFRDTFEGEAVPDRQRSSLRLLSSGDIRSQKLSKCIASSVNMSSSIISADIRTSKPLNPEPLPFWCPCRSQKG